MKQSTKLLSLVLALIMAFSCMSVIGNAALDKNQVKYDSIDDAALTPEQVADVVMDLLDGFIVDADLGTVDIVVAKLNMTNLDNLIASVYNLYDSFTWTIAKGLLGNVGDLNLDCLSDTSRANGDLNFLYDALQLLNDNRGTLSRVAYGIGKGTNQLSLGVVGNFLSLGDIEDLLADLPQFVENLLYDLLVYGSYGFNSDAEESIKATGDLPKGAQTLDDMLNQAVIGLLVSPQDYEYKDTDNDGKDEKIWNMDSLLVPSVAALGFDGAKAKFNLFDSGNSLFAILDKAAPYAIYDLGVGALNNNLKKALMEAVEADVNEVGLDKLPQDVKDYFEVDKEDGKESYVTYIAYDRIRHGSDGEWYYTTMKSQPILGSDGKPVLDEDGNEQSQKVRMFYKVNMASANDFAQLINWDWEIKVPEPGAEEDSPEFDLSHSDVVNYKALINEYGSITESLNHLLYIVFESAVNKITKDHFYDLTGAYWEDGATSATSESDSEKTVFMYNAERLLKYLLAEHADKIFGSDSPYVAWEYDDIEDYTLVDLIAIIGPTFFEDVMPQLIIPNDGEGMYLFDEGVQVLEFGAVVIREFMTEIAPNVNYDEYIFEAGSLESEEGRRFNKENEAEDWFNIILNMGMDIAYTYLYNITNFGDEITNPSVHSDPLGLKLRSTTVIEAPDESDPDKSARGDTRWKNMLNEAIMWAADYVGQGSTSVIAGLEPNTIAGYSDPFDKLSYILNHLLPLGFINGCTTEDFAFDVSVVFDRLKALLTDFDLSQLVGLFGRNTDERAYNFMDDANIVNAVLSLVNDILSLVFGQDILPNESSLTGLVTQANLKTIVERLFNSLYTRRAALLENALPVVAKFIQEWGGEQEMGTPEIGLSHTYVLNGGAGTGLDFDISNGSTGVWRHYRDANGEHQDGQYSYSIKSIVATDYFAEDNKTSYISNIKCSDNELAFGETANVTFDVANVPDPGAIARFIVSYTVSDEDNKVFTDKDGKALVFQKEMYTWLSYSGTNAGQDLYKSSDKYKASVYTPQYVPLSNALDVIPNLTVAGVWRERSYSEGAIIITAPKANQTQDGITIGYFGYNGTMTASDVEPQSWTNWTGGPWWNKTSIYTGANYVVGDPKPHEWDKTIETHRFSLFTNGPQELVNDEGEVQVTTYVNGASINADAWKAANKQPGSKTSWPMKLVIKTDESTDTTLDLIYYDDIYLGKLTSLVNDENDAQLTAEDVHLSGTKYADRILVTVDDPETEDENEIETNFTTLAWVDADGVLVADSRIDADSIKEVKDDNGNLIEATATADNKTVDVKKVTVINAETAYNNYVAALQAGIQGAYQEWNTGSVYTHEALYESLKKASNDIEFVKKNAEEQSGTSITNDVLALKSQLDTVEAKWSDRYDYTDYKMYRWNRYNDARGEASDIVSAYKATLRTADDINKYFPYTGIYPSEVTALAKGDQYESLITALYENYGKDTVKANQNALKEAKLHYARYTSLDVAQAKNLLNRIPDRLLKRDHGVDKTYLNTEIASAEAMIYDETLYTATSWANYQAALKAAKDIANDSTAGQMEVFDYKYNLLIARNRLVYDGEEADYTELKTLIAQAEYALENRGLLYDNTNKEFGQVLAELGYKEFTNADGDDIQLFPGSAKIVLARGYGVEDQDEVDDAARALKEALARLKFKGLTIEGNGVAVDNMTIVFNDEATPDVDETVVAKVATIAAGMDVDDVKGLFTVEATDASVTPDLITVSNDLHYALETNVDGIAGTNSVVTFYTDKGGIMVPVATVKIVVKGDINGDGVVDVLDGATASLVASEKANLEGCYFIAGNLVGGNTKDEVINAEDYGQIINIVVPNRVVKG